LPRSIWFWLLGSGRRIAAGRSRLAAMEASHFTTAGPIQSTSGPVYIANSCPHSLRGWLRRGTCANRLLRLAASWGQSPLIGLLLLSECGCGDEKCSRKQKWRAKVRKCKCRGRKLARSFWPSCVRFNRWKIWLCPSVSLPAWLGRRLFLSLVPCQAVNPNWQLAALPCLYAPPEAESRGKGNLAGNCCEGPSGVSIFLRGTSLGLCLQRQWVPFSQQLRIGK